MTEERNDNATFTPNDVENYIRDFMMTRMKEEQEDKAERFRHLNKMVRPHQILFVGSSLMEQFPIYELLLDKELPYTIYNRGIGGFTSRDLLEHLDECIFELQPDHIFINIGTNDLNGPDYSEEALIGRYRQILSEIKTRLPEAKIYMMAYYPVNPKVGAKIPFMNEMLQHRTNARISSANAAVESLAAEVGAVFIDANGGITDEEGSMKEEYTIEGMHMYGDGYEPVLEALLPYLQEIKENA